MSSIRRQLLVSMLAAVLAAGCIAALGVYYKARQEVDELLDYQLRQMALSLRDQALRGAFTLDVPPLAEGLDFAIQISSDDGFLLYYSQPGVQLPLRPQAGYSSLETPQGPWRAYALRERGLTLQVAQPLPMRNRLARDAAVRTLAPFLLTLPLLAGLLWLAVTRALKPLDAVTNAVKARSATSLPPLPESSAPQEVRPLIAALNDLLARLGHALESQRNLVADAAHELRTPLTALRLQAQLAERATEPQERASAFATLKQGLERAAHLVQQLLTLAREDPSAGERTMTDLELGEIAAHVVSDYSVLAESRGIDLGLARRDPDLIVRGEPEGLGTLLSNLVDNALRYTPRGGRVDVSAFRGADGITLEVSDDGPGIAPQERERVFDRFYRRADSDEPGSGLGLAIVRSIAQRHHARVQLDSGPGGVGLAARVVFHV
ncbi:MAG: ATP-binding protein [Burkholderiales bacterium]